MAQWLNFLNLAKYVGNFKENAIDGACLKMGLDDETLDALGVTLPIHRKKLQTCCAELFGGSQPVSKPSTPAAHANSAPPLPPKKLGMFTSLFFAILV